MKNFWLIVLGMVALAASGWAQEGSRPPVPAFGLEEEAPTPELPYSETLQAPIPVRSMQSPLGFSSDTPRSNYMMGSLHLTGGYDDNVLGSPSNRVSDMTYMILPSFHVGQTRERWTWDFGYSPGFTFSQRLTQSRQVAQDLQLLFSYRVSPHVTAQIRENFEKTNSLFSGVISNTAAGPGPLQQSNNFVVTPQTDRTGNSSALDLTYQTGANSLLGATGFFNLVNYGAPVAANGPTYALIDSHSAGGDGFYAHRFSDRHWLGVAYNFQRLMFDPGNRTDVDRTLLFYSVSANDSSLTFSVWGGPEREVTVLPSSALGGILPSGTRWNGAAGALASWQGRKTSFWVEYVRQASDGGGLAQAVRMQGVDVEGKQRLSARWTAGVGLGYAKNTPLSNASQEPPFRNIRGNAGLEYALSDSLQFGFQYGRDQLTYEYANAVHLASNRNRAWFTVTYSFARPLGR